MALPCTYVYLDLLENDQHRISSDLAALHHMLVDDWAVEPRPHTQTLMQGLSARTCLRSSCLSWPCTGLQRTHAGTLPLTRL